jgi:rRNA-processing protein FCF1
MLHRNEQYEWPTVIFDSSIIISLFECKVDPISEIERVLSTRFNPTVLSGTLLELNDLLRFSKGEKRRKMLELALKTVEKFKRLDYVPAGEEEMDDVITRVARKLKAIVATNDGKLRKTLTKMNIPVLFLREKSHIEMDGYTSDIPRQLDSLDCCDHPSDRCRNTYATP